MRTIFLLALLSTLPLLGFAKDPDCSGIDQWSTKMAFVHLKNAGITDNDKIDFTKTHTTKLASQRIGDDLYCQIHHVLFTEKTGRTIEVITSSDASSKECSMSGVEVFVISNHLGGK
jgi:hypothetical protein